MRAEKAKFSEQSLRLSTLQRDHSSLQTLRTAIELDLTASRSALSQFTADMSTLQCRYDAVKVKRPLPWVCKLRNRARKMK